MIKIFKKFGIPLYFIGLFFFLEGFSRVVLSKDEYFGIKIFGDDDSSFRLQWINRNRGKKEIGRKHYYHPKRGWWPPSNYRKENWSGVLLTTNARGLRGDIDYSYEKPADKKRIVILGDSYTYGNEVEHEQTYSSLLQQMMKKTEIINMGMGAYGHDQMYLLLKDEGVQYKPDILVLGFVYLDIFRNNVQFSYFAKPKFEIEGNALKLLNVPVPHAEEIYAEEFYQLKIFDMFQIIYNRFLRKTRLLHKECEQLTALILDEIIKTARQIGAKPLFVYLPAQLETMNTQPAPLPGEQFLFAYCQSRRIACTSLRRYFIEQVKAGKKFETEKHWTPFGHQVAAKGLKVFLDEQLDQMPKNPS